MPQTITSGWKQHLGEEWSESYTTDLHTLGNLTLTAYNGDLSNADFNAKKKILLESKLQLNQYCSTCEHWRSADIKQRGECLAEQAAKLWPVNLFIAFFQQLMLASFGNQYNNPEALAELLTANQNNTKSLLQKSWQAETECLELKEALAQKQMEKKSYETDLAKNQRQQEWLQGLLQLQQLQKAKQEKPVTGSQPNSEHKPDEEEGKQNTFGIMKLKL